MIEKMQDLEQQIMDCWGMVDDIKSCCQAKYINDDRVLNLLNGLSELYQIKFENLWQTYEAALGEYYNRRASKKVSNY